MCLIVNFIAIVNIYIYKRYYNYIIYAIYILMHDLMFNYLYNYYILLIYNGQLLLLFMPHIVLNGGTSQHDTMHLFRV